MGRIFREARIKISTHRDILCKDPRIALWPNISLRCDTRLRTWGRSHRLGRKELEPPVPKRVTVTYVLWEVTHTGSVVEVEVAVGYCEIFP